MKLLAEHGQKSPGRSRAGPVKYLLKIDLLCFDGQLGVQPVQTKGGAMIKLSDVKVRPQYRPRVR